MGKCLGSGVICKYIDVDFDYLIEGEIDEYNSIPSEISELIKQKLETNAQKIENLIFLNDLARELNTDHSQLRKFVKANNIPYVKAKNPVNHQIAIALSKENTKKLIELKLG